MGWGSVIDRQSVMKRSVINGQSAMKTVQLHFIGGGRDQLVRYVIGGRWGSFLFYGRCTLPIRPDVHKAVMLAAGAGVLKLISI
jgi:hypothetical protein